MKKAKPHINNLSTSRKLKIGDMVCYDVMPTGMATRHDDTMQPEHGLVVEISMGSIVKVRPLQNFNAIRLLNVADCRVIKAKEDEQV